MTGCTVVVVGDFTCSDVVGEWYDGVGVIVVGVVNVGGIVAVAGFVVMSYYVFVVYAYGVGVAIVGDCVIAADVAGGVWLLC